MAGLDLTLGALEVGVLLSSVLYGVVTIQYYIYTEGDFKDPLWIRIVAVLVWLCETIQTIFSWVLLYDLTVTSYGKPSTFFETREYWSMKPALPVSSLVGALVQGFFAYRVYALSRSLIIPVIVWSGGLLRCAFGTTVTILLVKSPALANLFARYEWLITLHLITDVATDILTTASLCYYLLRGRTGLRSTRRIVDKLVIFSVETGLITSICAIVLLITSFIRPDTLIFWGVLMLYPKFFSISLYTSLNARKALRKAGTVTHVWSTGDSTRPTGSSHQRSDTETPVGLELSPKLPNFAHQAGSYTSSMPSTFEEDHSKVLEIP